MKKNLLILAGMLFITNFAHSQAVGIGDVSFTPNYLLQIHRNAASGVALQLTNTTTGALSTDGFQINLNGAAIELNNRENEDMRFFTNNTERMTIEAAGNVGVGTNTPTTRFVVNGGQTTLSRDATYECCGNSATLALGEATTTYGTRASISFHNGGEAEGSLQLIQNTVSGVGVNSRRFRMFDNQGSGMGLEITGGLFYGNTNSRTETRNNAGLQGSSGSQSGFFETSTPTNFPAGASSWWHLIDARHSNNANNYAMQIAGSFFDQDFYARKTNNNASQAWTRILTSSYLNANQYFDYSTGGITTNASMQTIPGMTRTLSLNAGDKVILFAFGGMQANGTVYSSADIRIAVNGSDLPNGGYTKVTVDYAGTRYLLNQNFSIFGHYIVPATGSYTFTVQAQQTAPSSGSSVIGGNNTTVLQGCLMTEIIKP